MKKQDNNLMDKIVSLCPLRLASSEASKRRAAQIDHIDKMVLGEPRLLQRWLKVITYD